MYETDDTQLQFFKSEFLKWAKLLGLVSWEFCFLKGMLEDKDAQAFVVDYQEDRLAKVYYSPSWCYKPDDKDISRVAFHEVCEIFLSDLESLIADNKNEDETRKEIHKIIRTLENVVFERFYNGNNFIVKYYNGHSE